DTAYLAPTMSLPFYEDFSNGRTPDLWDLGTAFSVGIAPLSFSNALVASLDGDNPDGTIITTSYGEFVEMDTLRFTIELSNRDGGDFTGKASLDLSIFQCDIQSEIFMIDSLENREYAIALSDISSMFTLGQIIFTFSADMGDFTLAIDDITVARCPEALGLIANVVGVSSSGATDAIASVTPTLGISPFRYVWSTGDNEQQVDGLAEGPLSVTVIDAVGCQDSVFFTVDQSTAAEDPDQLLAGLNASPNPTTEAVTLRLELPEVRSLQASVFDLTGRQLLFQDFGRQRLLNERIDFSAFPTGVYLLRLQTEDAARTLRVIRR
ncbi:MAG: T9SS type A sorting domain-containing protein, partial [Bacteroidota bacterium]